MLRNFHGSLHTVARQSFLFQDRVKLSHPSGVSGAEKKLGRKVKEGHNFTRKIGQVSRQNSFCVSISYPDLWGNLEH